MKPWTAKPWISGGHTVLCPAAGELAQSPRSQTIYIHTVHTIGPERCPLKAQEVAFPAHWCHVTAISTVSLPLAQFLPTHFSQYLGCKRVLEGSCELMPWQPRSLWGTYCVH